MAFGIRVKDDIGWENTSINDYKETPVTTFQKLKEKLLAVLPSFLKGSPQESNFKFVNLAPTAKADKTGIYSDALSKAINDPNVYNIALTGPYGSGKSSIIKTFLTKQKEPALLISLAAFIPEVGTDKTEAKKNNEAKDDKEKAKTKKQEIERSILQQMLYGADANDLPLSRFKRIQKPKWWAGGISLLIILGSFAVWYLFQQRKEIATGDFFFPVDRSNWFNLTCFTIGSLFLWGALHRIYLKSLGLSLKGISLKNLELTPETADEESILNRHLDEIIYFFQSTTYELVIVEDLDRFDNPDIFVTLREINGLINANAGIKRQVRFLYALRDDMFVNTDRTKFFEFIIPVIPIINHSNSFDKVREQGQRLLLDEKLDKQFLREVSRYLNDLRLIHNIFNEYIIYVANLEKEEEGVIEPNKLLAVLIYKNVLPRDFEELHQQKGTMAEILRRKDEYIIKEEKRQKQKISALEEELAQVEKLSIRNEAELRKVYAMALIERIPASHSFVRVGNITTSIAQLAKHEHLNEFITTNIIFTGTHSNNTNSQTQITPIQNNVDPNKTFKDRVAEIKKKGLKFKTQAGRKIHEMQSKIKSLRTQKFNEIIRANPEQTEEIFNKFGDSKDLMKFLIFEGYLDDTYYQYISLSHSRSPNDDKFLFKIRGFDNPDPDYQIDNPSEIIEEMRDEDFEQCYFLNRHLVDALLDNPQKNKARIEKAVSYISTNFASCDDFFTTFFQTGRHVEALVKLLISEWANYPQSAATTAHSAAHIARITAYAPEALLSAPSFAQGEFSVCWNTDTAEVLREDVDFDLDRLKLLRVKVKSLESIAEFSKEAKYVIEHGLYQVSIKNINFALKQDPYPPNSEDLETSNYTTILASGNKPLISLLEQDFDHYMRHVLLSLAENTKEEVGVILQVLNNEDVEAQLQEQFLVKQSAIFPLLAEIPHRFHSAVLQNRQMNPTWENCQIYLDSESYSSEILSDFLEDADIQEKLFASPIPDGKDAFSIRNFLISNNGFDNDVFRKYVRKLPKQFQAFPEDINQEKLRIIIEEQKVIFKPENFNSLDESDDLQVLFVAKNIAEFLRDLEDYDPDDEFLMKLLSSDIRNDQKYQIIQAINPEFISTDATRSSAVGQILNRVSVNAIEFDHGFILAIIANSSPVSVQVSLLNKFYASLTSEQVRQILSSLPEPFHNIPTYGNSLSIPDTPENEELVSWLEEQEIISSSTLVKKKNLIRINKFKKPKV